MHYYTICLLKCFGPGQIEKTAQSVKRGLSPEVVNSTKRPFKTGNSGIFKKWRVTGSFIDVGLLVPFTVARNRHNIRGILKGEVSLYHWPPVWLVCNQLYDNGQFLFLFAKQTNRIIFKNFFLLVYFFSKCLNFFLMFRIPGNRY